jgi:hypothetical protein
LKAVDDVRTRTTPFDKADPDVMDQVMGRGRYAA